ncbi:hypothetical protein [Clostridium sp. OF09-36]|uniref:hypothetical protein n=1 Tax=Clostridium sp. OF09-36 TaxID=2292310 RepID=UPI00242BAC4D|nr:hypothetical protein [Clostridium sp. OF09-36]
MKKKVVSVALAAAMTAGVLAGCGGSSSKETTAAPAAEKTEEKADAAESTELRLRKRPKAATNR